MIAAHPDTWVPPLKELHFFDRIDPDVPSREHRFSIHLPSRLKHRLAPLAGMRDRAELYKNGWREALRWDWRYFTGPFTQEWYCSLFDRLFTKGRLCGEFTPAYCNIGRSTIRKILEINPRMKFLMMVRHPLDQMRSSLVQHFVMIERRRFESVTEEEMLAWLGSPFALKKCNLAAILGTWLSEIPPAQMHIGHHADIAERPEGLIREIYAFLGLDPRFMPDPSYQEKKINAMKIRNVPAVVERAIAHLFTPELERLRKMYPGVSERWR